MEISKLLVKLIHVLQHISGDVAQKVASQSEKLRVRSVLSWIKTERWGGQTAAEMVLRPESVGL